MDTVRQQLADVENTPGLGLLCLLGAATGGLCGLVILALHTAIHTLQEPLFEIFGVASGTFTDSSIAFRVAVPVLGALLLGLLVEWVIKSSEYGIVHIIERLVYYQGVLPMKAALAEFTMSALALATGQSVGREGVAAHTGATTGSWLGRQLGLPNNSVRTLVGCGAAAGIAASFNTPLAAVIFAMEVVMMEYTIAGFAPIILAAVTGSLVTFTFTDVHPRLMADYSGFSPVELPYLALVGALLGIAGASFTRLCGALVPLLGKVRISLRIALAGLVTGLLAVQFPQIMGLGFETVNASLAGEYAIAIALGVGLAKLLATSFATAAAIPGGSSDSVRKPCAMVPPKGDSRFARSTSTWIHWWSSVASAKPSTRCWSMVSQSLAPISRPTQPCSASMLSMTCTGDSCNRARGTHGGQGAQ